MPSLAAISAASRSLVVADDRDRLTAPRRAAASQIMAPGEGVSLPLGHSPLSKANPVVTAFASKFPTKYLTGKSSPGARFAPFGEEADRKPGPEGQADPWHGRMHNERRLRGPCRVIGSPVIAVFGRQH